MRSEKLWRVWWLWGMPVAWTASALVLAAEYSRGAGQHDWGNAFDVARLGLYWWWMRIAWACSANVQNPLWSPLSRAALLLGLTANALI
jgi:hypothetical protein